MKYNIFREKINSEIFTKQDLRLLGLKVFPYQLSLWQKQGYLTKLKNGVYIFSDALNKTSPEKIARILYEPSYISLETALSIYGLIPEMVYATTSVTPKTTRSFKNKFGQFIYKHIKPALFFGYNKYQDSSLIADPEKALLDLIYLNKIKTEVDLDSLRLNWFIIKKIFNKNKFKKYSNAYKNFKVIKKIEAKL
jgi:predicted transcriptional regulator of viral defense system